MGRFSLGSSGGGRFFGHAPASPPLVATAGRREVSSGRRGVRATSSKRNFCAAFKKKAGDFGLGSPGGSCAATEPVKKAGKFGLRSSGGLLSMDDGEESQVGPASESDEAHRRRHPVRVKDCARCAFLEIGPQLRQGRGSYKHEVHGERARTVWLTQRPSRLPGLWGVVAPFAL